MKQMLFVLAVLGTFIRGFSQAPALFIATDKTVSLVFPFAVRHVDQGSPSVLVQPIAEDERVLLIKAAAPEFTATNLTVLTSDGSVYAFDVRYQSAPMQWVYHLPSWSTTPLQTVAERLMDNSPVTHGMKAERWELRGAVSGIYTKGEWIFYQISIFNQSTLDDDLDGVRFSVVDRKTRKRTALQIRQLTPLLTCGNTHSVAAGSQNVLVFAFPRFTLPGKRFLRIEILEKNGGRNLELKVTNRKIIRARQIPDDHPAPIPNQ